ncbi:MAG: TPM domain-containing protein, partial [Burkholderiaceae bacterium]
AFEQAKGSQIAVVVVPSTQPEPISDFTNRVGDAWKIGRKGVGDGVLMVVAVKDRRVWISVARALEGAIPDVVATRITREFMGPQFARGDFAAGIDAGVSAVMKQIEGEALPTPSGVPRNKVDAGEDLLGALVPLVIFGTLVGALLRRIFGVPGSMLSGAGTGAIAGFMLSSLVVGAIAGIAVMVLSGFGGGRGPLGGGRVLGGRRGAPVILPGGWSGGGSWGGGFGGGGGGGWSSGGGGDFAGGGGGSSW